MKRLAHCLAFLATCAWIVMDYHAGCDSHSYGP